MSASDPGLDAATEAFFVASRALVGISVRSVAAAPVAMTVPQHRLLVLVSREARRIGVLAQELGVNQSNASRLVDRMVARGLVRRVTDPEDRRVSVVEPTAAGLGVLDVVGAHRRRELRAIVGQMPPQVRATAVDALRTFNDAADEGRW